MRFVPVPPERFLAFAEPGQVKIVWTLEAEPDPLRPGGSLFRTETRVEATDEEARRRFRRYWRVFSPGIVLSGSCCSPRFDARVKSPPGPSARPDALPGSASTRRESAKPVPRPGVQRTTRGRCGASLLRRS